ncbi:histidine kinase [Afipia sp. P52-10]|uniref:sensor histidine kinase n=1 Tax=Afipia sp. P52-10 TaxID=1429916 RepID=UPI0003DF3B4A|nr:HAMP domain-containing sensor histidine kinase [Afipia sp. P52-10]ETR79224.1 histidine kinase [Afipia sp. P52-10]
MTSINRTLMWWLSLAAGVIFVAMVVSILGTIHVTSWDPARICRAAVSIVAKTMTQASGPNASLIFSETDDFSALNASSPELWFAASKGAEVFEFNRDRRPQLPFEVPYQGSATRAIFANANAEQTVCLDVVETPASGLVLTVAGAQPTFGMSLKHRFSTVMMVSLAIVGSAFAAIVAIGVFLAGRFVKRSIARVTKMAIAIDPAAPQGSIPLADVPLELQSLVKSLNGAFDEIATFLERERRFLGNAAHELRTPLAILRTKLEGVTDSKLRATLVLDTRRLTSLVSAMLDLSRLKGAELQRNPVDLAEVTRDVLADYGPLALDQGMDLSLISDCDKPIIVLGSKEAIRSAIANLVGNALVHAYGARTIVARLYRDGAVSICDDGRPVAQDQASGRSMVVKSAALEHSGTGLGLPIVREIMAAHQGRLSMTTTPGGGTTAHLVFDTNLEETP